MGDRAAGRSLSQTGLYLFSIGVMSFKSHRGPLKLRDAVAFLVFILS